MKKKIITTLIVICSLLFLLGVVIVGGLFIAIKSGRLERYIERRAEQATGLQVQIGSLHLRWPLVVSADAVSAALPGDLEQPLLVSERLQVTTSLRALLRRRLVLVEVIAPKVSVTEETIQFLEEHMPAMQGDSEDGFSIALLQITRGTGQFSLPGLQAHLHDFDLTFGHAILPPAEKRVLSLDVKQGHFEFPAGEKPLKVALRDLRGNLSFVPSDASTEIKADLKAGVTANLPPLALPPDFPVGVSLAADYQKKQDLLNNVVLNVDIPSLKKTRAEGSISNLTENPILEARFSAEAPRLGELIEYIEVLKRPEYKQLQAAGSLKLEGEIDGTLRAPSAVLRANLTDGKLEWNGLQMKGLTAEIPGLIERQTVTLGPASIAIEAASLPLGEGALDISRATAIVLADSSDLTVRDFRAAVAPLGNVAARAGLNFATNRFNGNLSIHDASSEAAIELLADVMGSIPEDLKLSGKYQFACNFEGLFGSELEELNADFLYRLRQGAFSPNASTTLTGLDTELKGSASTTSPADSWKFDVAGSAGNFTLKSDSFQKAFAGETFPLSLSGIYDAVNKRITDAAAEMEFGSRGKFALSGDFALASGMSDLALRAEKLNIQEILELVPPALYQLPPELSLAGTADLQGALEGVLLPEPSRLKGNFSIEVRDGEFASGELITAAGVSGDARGSFETDSPAEAWTFNVSGQAGGFELLIETYYNSFQNSNFPFSVSGKYLVEEHALEEMNSSITLADIGEISAGGAVKFSPQPAFDLRIKSEKIDLNQLYEQVGRQVLSTASPIFNKAQLGGHASGDIAFRCDGATWESKGIMQIDSSRFWVEDSDTSVGSIAARLPFALHSPNAEDNRPIQFDEEDFGTIRLREISVGPAKIADLVLEAAVKGNALYIKNPAEVQLLEGKLDLGEVRAKNLLDSSLEIKTSLTAEGVDITQLSQAMGMPEIPGALYALFPNLLVSRENVSATGKAAVYAFNGTVTIESVEVEQPLSPVRTFKADLAFEEINLSHLTDALNFGTITGVMEGTIHGLEISQGQPAAFVADFETVKKRRTPQRISFDAVENISILGTGRGFQATISRGLFSFIDEFRYDTIGFRTTLKNDNFRLSGKVVRDGTEYFVKGVTLGPSINVINRNPGQTVSFKSMLERIGRIGRSQSEGPE